MLQLAGTIPEWADLNGAGRHGLEHLNGAITPALCNHPRRNLEDQSFRKPIDCINSFEIANFFQCLEHQLLEMGHPPESRFGRSMPVRGVAVLEWMKELREVYRFRRASSRVIKSIIRPPYPRALHWEPRLCRRDG